MGKCDNLKWPLSTIFNMNLMKFTGTNNCKNCMKKFVNGFKDTSLDK